MEDLVSEVLINGVVIPMVVAIVCTILLRFCLGKTIGSHIASISIGLAFLAGYALLYSWPDFPPRNSSQKLVFIVLIGCIIGLIFDLLKSITLLKYLTIILWPLVIIGWLGWRQVMNISVENALPLGILVIIAIFIFDRLVDNGARHSNSVIMLMVAAIGASFISLIGASGSLSQNFAVVAAASGGFLLCNWPTARFSFGSAALMSGGGALVGLMTSVVLFSEVHLGAFAILLFIFLAPPIANKLPLRNNTVIAPVIIGIISGIPVVISTVFALYIAGDSFELPF